TGADRKARLPLRLGRVGIAVELEWGTEGHPAIGGADVEDIPRVAVAGVAGGINVVNHVVIGGWLTPAHVPPVSGAAVHGAEVACSSTASADEGRAGVSIRPGIAAIGGTIDLVISVGAAAGSTATAAVFVHTGEVRVARDEVPGNLHVANERSRNLALVSPCVTVVSGIANENIPAASEVVPSNIHPSVERR